MGFERVLERSLCLPWFMLGLVGTLITGGIVQKERQNRKLETGAFTSNALRITSAICLWCGPISTILLTLAVIPGFCMMDTTGNVIVFSTQFMFMGFYQQSRLYYCFGNEQLHGCKGYSLWVFIAMVAVGAALLILWIMLHTMVDPLLLKCGFRNDAFRVFWRYRDRSLFFDGDPYSDEHLTPIYYLWNLSVTTAVQLWDMTTLLLYCYKIREIGKIHKMKDDAVWESVQFILHRIVIVTIFYQITSFLLAVVHYALSAVSLSGPLGNVVLLFETVCIPSMFSILVSLSMYLMMEHNTEFYIRFLHFLRGFNLHYLCFCCCRKMLDRQLLELEIPQLEARSPKHKGTLPTKHTMYPNNSVDVVYETAMVQTSIDTVTCVNTNDLLLQPTSVVSSVCPLE